MSLTQTDKPQFYQGQFLGPDELAASVEYARLHRARHILGGHTWGIAIGLDLIEIPVPGGGNEVDVFIQPGYAWDGFGRPIVLFTPQKLPLELLKDEQSGLVKVWIRYTELQTGTVEPGFESCLTEGFSRIRESFQIEIGNLSHSDQHDGIILAEQSVDAMETCRFFDADDPPDNPLLCDESVPFQTFPEDNVASCWRIPLGFVNWLRGADGQPGSLQKLTGPLHIKESRSVRRYIGAVAEDLFAADGIIRLRDRKKEAPADGNFAAAYEADLIDYLTDLDMVVENDEAKPVDLVWVEGNMRAIGDIKLFGGSLDFRDSDGLPFNNNDGSAPRLFMQRAEYTSGDELRIVLANSGDGSNRLSIGPIETDMDQFPNLPDLLKFAPRVVIQDDAKVGIGTESPSSFNPAGDDLVVSSGSSTGITIVSPAENTGSLLFADGDNVSGNDRQGFVVYDHPQDQLRIGTAGIDQLTILRNGNTGLGTIDPQYGLDIRRSVHMGFSVGMGADAGRIWTEYRNAGPNLIFYDKDDVGGIIRFRESPNTEDEANPEFEAFITGRRGHIGIGTTSPSANLTVIGQSVFGDNSVAPGSVPVTVSGSGAGISFLDRGGVTDRFVIYNSSGALRFWEDGDRMAIRENTGHVGIGTSAPEQLLHIFGGDDPTIKIQSDGTNEISGRLALRQSNDTGTDIYYNGTGGIEALQIETFLFGGSQGVKLTLQNDGDVGIGTESPQSRLHVTDAISGDEDLLSSHVVTIENTSSGSDADVLALKVGNSTPGDNNHFISFFGAGVMRGRIEGSAAGVAILSGSGDFAECLPRLDRDERMEAGDIVGIFSGNITRVTEGAHHLSAITNKPVVVGNMPLKPGELSLHEKVAFMGQVPVRVRGKVRGGDFILPSGLNDGTGIAVSPGSLTRDQHVQVVGKAWESSEDEVVKMINTSIGLPLNNLGGEIIDSIESQQLEINRLRAEVEYLRSNHSN